MYALSKLNYIPSLVIFPHWVYKEVAEISFEFIWMGNDGIKRALMYQDYDFGRLRMINFEISVKIQRIMRIKRFHTERKIWDGSCFLLIGDRFNKNVIMI